MEEQPAGPTPSGNNLNISNFCKNNCVVNFNQKSKKCYDDGMKKCFSCKTNPASAQFKNNPDANLICRIACNNLKDKNTCDYYGYNNNKKKLLRNDLLSKLGLKAFRKYLLKLKY